MLSTDHTGLADGWRAIERDGATAWRWTDGDAAIPTVPRVRTIVVELHSTAAYPVVA